MIRFDSRRRTGAGGRGESIRLRLLRDRVTYTCAAGGLGGVARFILTTTVYLETISIYSYLNTV